MNKVHFNVNGLINNTMKLQVKSVLNELDGIQKVNVDLVRGSVEVDYNEPANENQIRNSIEHIGCKVE